MAAQDNSGYETYYVPEQSKMALCATVGLITAIFGIATVMNDITFGEGTENTHSWAIFYTGLAFFVGTLFVWFRMTIRENRQRKTNGAERKKAKRSEAHHFGALVRPNTSLHMAQSRYCGGWAPMQKLIGEDQPGQSQS